MGEGRGKGARTFHSIVVRVEILKTRGFLLQEMQTAAADESKAVID